MNPSFSPSNPASDEAASLWAARLDGSDLSAHERSELTAWLNAHPSHRPLLSSYCQFSADLEPPLTALVESGAVLLPTAERAARKGPRWKIYAGSLLMAAAAVAFAVWFAHPATQYNGISTPLAQRQSVILSDGTRVDLNSQTQLQVAITDSERRVRLLGGEAFFAVHKDPARPFVIETPGGSVRVTGTTFDVRSETAAHLEVTVVEGSVQVRPGDNGELKGPPVLLGAGDQLSSGPTGVSVKALPTAAVENALAWRKGQIVFDGVPLKEALARFARYHGQKLQVADDCANLTVGGRFSLEDPQGFYAGLEEFLTIRITTDPSGLVRVIRRDQP